MTLLDEVLDAHGGAERWRRARTIRGAGALAAGCCCAPACRGNRFADGRIEVAVGEPRAVARPVSARRAGAASSTTAPCGSRPLDGEVLESRERPARALLRPLRAAPQPALGRARRAPTSPATRGGTTSTRRYLLARDGVAVARGRAVAERRRRDLAPARGALPGRASTRTRRARSSTTTPSCGCAATTTPPRWSAAGRAAAHMCADHVEAGGLVLPDPPLGAPDRPAATGRCRCRPWSLCNSPRSRSISSERRQAGPLAHPGLALQREGALGARPQGRRARAPGAAPRARTWRSRSGSPAGRTSTFPVLRLDGRNIGDSTAIIAALEER